MSHDFSSTLCLIILKFNMRETGSYVYVGILNINLCFKLVAILSGSYQNFNFLKEISLQLTCVAVHTSLFDSVQRNVKWDLLAHKPPNRLYTKS